MTEMQSDIMAEINRRAAQDDKSGYAASGEVETDRSCVRCAHHRKQTEYQAHICERPQLGSTRDDVIGVHKPNRADCYDERRNPLACGPEGKFWAQSGF